MGWGLGWGGGGCGDGVGRTGKNYRVPEFRKGAQGTMPSMLLSFSLVSFYVDCTN